MSEEFLIFTFVGFLAQLVDGALGMAYGVTASTVLLSAGVSPAHASAATHAAEVFTTAASGGSHIINRNIDWRMFWLLAPAGMAGGALGAFALASFDGAILRPLIFGYLGLMGVYIIFRVLWPPREAPKANARLIPPLGAAGGLLDAVGGGGWGPIVTTTLVGAGEQPRYVIGTVNAAEFLVTVAISASFVLALVTGHWRETEIWQHLTAVAGLVVGGVCAAPFAGRIVKTVSPRVMGLLVGGLILGLSLWQMARWLKVM